MVDPTLPRKQPPRLSASSQQVMPQRTTPGENVSRSLSQESSAFWSRFYQRIQSERATEDQTPPRGQPSGRAATSQQILPQRTILKENVSRSLSQESSLFWSKLPQQTRLAPRRRLSQEAESHSEGHVIPQDRQEGAVPHGSSNGHDSVYETLRGDQYIRRLVLDPGKDDDALVGRLEVIDLSQAHGCFEAISYVWGPDNKDQTIIIDGQPIAITKTLRDSLRQTRKPDEPRALWADAICINQDDDREKGYQVALMGQIYKASRCTLICLGYVTGMFGFDTERSSDSNFDDRSSETAADWPRDVAALIADVNGMMDRVFDKPGFDGDWNSFPRPEADDPFLAAEKWRSWSRLITQPWFFRGWVVQEAALGPECRVLWADVEIPWLSFLRVYFWLLRRSFHLIKGLTHWVISILHSRMYALERPKEFRTLTDKATSLRFTAMSTLQALDVARRLELKDPKDRIYAFMAFPTSDAAAMPDLQPDYGEDTSHLDVYRDFAAKYIQTTSDLNILAFVVHGDELEENEAPAPTIDSGSPRGQVHSRAFPSWIPRWDRRTPPATSIYSDQTNRKINEDIHEATLLNHNSTLRVKAVIFDSVKYVSPVIKREDQARQAVTSAVLLWRDIAEQSKRYPGPHQSRLDLAFLDMLSIGRFTGDVDKWYRALAAFANLLQSDNPVLSMDTYEKDDNAQIISKEALDISNRQRFLVLGRGYYGLSSTATREGDACAIIFGTRSPFILREVAGERDCYTLVGPAYVHSAVLRQDGTPHSMGDHDHCDDWKDWDLPTRDIYLC